MSSIIFGSLALWVLVQQTSSLENCMVQTLNGAISTKPGLSLKGHMKKKLQTTSFIQCGMRCLQTDWCVSINFEVSKSSGICELNNHGLRQNGDLLENFEERKGFVYSQLRLLEVGVKSIVFVVCLITRITKREKSLEKNNKKQPKNQN